MMEVKRKVSTVVLTEEGLFHEGNMPDDYDGPFLNVEVTHSILFADERGSIFTLTLAAPKAKDSNRADALYPTDSIKTLVADPSEDFGDEQVYRHRLPKLVRDRAEGMINIIESDGSQAL